jgi:hypothetical protein
MNSDFTINKTVKTFDNIQNLINTSLQILIDIRTRFEVLEKEKPKLYTSHLVDIQDAINRLTAEAVIKRYKV